MMEGVIGKWTTRTEIKRKASVLVVSTDGTPVLYEILHADSNAAGLKVPRAETPVEAVDCAGGNQISWLSV